MPEWPEMILEPTSPKRSAHSIYIHVDLLVFPSPTFHPVPLVFIQLKVFGFPIRHNSKFENSEKKIKSQKLIFFKFPT